MLKDRVGLVTGGASGIGRATVLAMAAAGAKVIVADVDEAGGEEAAREVREAGGAAEFLRTDVAIATDVNAMVERALSTFGGLDAAFNNAGVEGDQAPLPEQDMARVQRVFDIMINGVYLAMQAEIPAMQEKGGGAIVNMSLMWGLAGYPEWSPYITAKHAVSGMTKSAALEGRGRRQPHQCRGAGADPHSALATRLEQRRIRSVGTRADAPYWPPRGGCQRRGVAAFRSGQLHHRPHPTDRRRHAGREGLGSPIMIRGY